MQQLTEQLDDHISFSYSSFDRVLLRGYLPNLFVEGSVIRLLRNLGFTSHSNGVLRTMTNQFNDHINKTSKISGIKIHWWGESEKQKYHSKIDFVEEHYSTQLKQANRKSKVVCIIKAVENTRTLPIKKLRPNKGRCSQRCIPVASL